MKKTSASATMFGAVSIVNAIASGKGCTLGISLKVKAKVTLEPGHRGISKNFVNDRLINKIIKTIIPSSVLNNNFISISLTSEIPAGWGLKSSSAVSNAISLACHKLVYNDLYDKSIINTAVNSSLWAQVSITGAFDDACACYYGGTILTDNYFRKLIKRDQMNSEFSVVIFLPEGIPRGNPLKLRVHKELFHHAFKLALKGDYWKAMNLNGLLINSVLYNYYSPLLDALEQHCVGISYSGNGPAIAAVVFKDNITEVTNALEKYNGNILVCKVNNTKAFVE